MANACKFTSSPASNLREGTYKRKDVAFKQMVVADITEIQRSYALKEILCLESIKCDKFVDILQIFEYQDRILIVMEKGEGDLQALLQNCGFFSQHKARILFKQITEGIVYLHNSGFAHRDLKLANIVHFNEDQLKIIDLGFCIKKDDSEDLSMFVCSTHCGTIGYLAQEVLQDLKCYDPFRSDAFSLGCILFQLTAGRLPHEGDSVQVLEKQLNRNVIFPDHASTNL